jgi:hypothetical protein
MKLQIEVVSEALNSLGVQDWTLRGDPTNEAEFNEMFFKTMPDGSASNNPSDFGVTWSQIEPKITQIRQDEPLDEVRMVRNLKLAETDWWVLPDRTATQAQLDYRQALRDITNTYTSLDDVVWPTKP